MSIHDLVLFVSSTSVVCAPVVYYVRDNNLPVRLVRLDTPTDRELAATGNRSFQIHTVPTLLVTYTTGDLRLFVGHDKIMQWLSQILTAQPKTSQSSLEDETILISDEEKPPKHKKKPKKSKEKSQKKSGVGLYDGKKKKPKKPPVSFGEESEGDSGEEIEIEYIPQEPINKRNKRGSDRQHNQQSDSYSNRPPPPPTAGLMVGQQFTGKRKSQMTNLFEQAKRMAQDREETLGYNEADLPVST